MLPSLCKLHLFAYTLPFFPKGRVFLLIFILRPWTFACDYFSWLMFGHVEWHFTWCWLGHTLLKTRRIQRTLGKLFKWVFSSLHISDELHAMLTPFNLALMFLFQRIMAVQYKIPDYVHISQDCRHLLSRIFVANSARVCSLLSLLGVF